jgi:hypothetical protein
MTSKTKFHRGALLLLVALLNAAAFGQTVWNPTTEFSTTSNPNGVWTYGFMNVDFTGFTPATSYKVDGFGFELWYNGSNPPPHVGLNASATVSYNVPVGALALHPGGGTEPAVLRWTAPVGYAGLIDINGQFLIGDTGQMLVAVRKGSTVLWNSSDFGSFNLPSVSVLAGDTVDFAVYGGFTSGNTPLELTITGTSAIPEPSTYAAIFGAVALVAVAIRRSRRQTRGAGLAAA